MISSRISALAYASGFDYLLFNIRPLFLLHASAIAVRRCPVGPIVPVSSRNRIAWMTAVFPVTPQVSVLTMGATVPVPFFDAIVGVDLLVRVVSGGGDGGAGIDEYASQIGTGLTDCWERAERNVRSQ